LKVSSTNRLNANIRTLSITVYEAEEYISNLEMKNSDKIFEIGHSMEVEIFNADDDAERM
jgi:hypothetical protein